MLTFLPGIIALLVLLVHLYQKRKWVHIHQWQKTWNLNAHQRVFNALYAESNGFQISADARKKQDALDYIYGEIEFTSFIALLSLSNMDASSVLYDLGSGSGKAVLAAGLVFPVQKCVGIEIFPELYQEACNKKELLATYPDYATHAKKISFIAGDFLEVSLEEATHIFINSTALFDPTWKKLCARINSAVHLEFVISTSKPLSSNDFTVIKTTEVAMSWGVVRAYIHQRKRKEN